MSESGQGGHGKRLLTDCSLFIFTDRGSCGDPVNTIGPGLNLSWRRQTRLRLHRQMIERLHSTGGGWGGVGWGGWRGGGEVVLRGSERGGWDGERSLRG